jgi:hypothetical protein
MLLFTTKCMKIHSKGYSQLGNRFYRSCQVLRQLPIFTRRRIYERRRQDKRKTNRMSDRHLTLVYCFCIFKRSKCNKLFFFCGEMEPVSNLRSEINDPRVIRAFLNVRMFTTFCSYS